VIFETVEVLISLLALVADVLLLLDNGVREAAVQRQGWAAGYRRRRRGGARWGRSLRGGGSRGRVSGQIVLVADTMHAMIFQAVHILVGLVATQVLAFIGFIDDDCVFGGDDAGGLLLVGSGFADGLWLGDLVDGELGPFLDGPFLVGGNVEVVEGKGDRGGRERLVRRFDG